MKIGVTFPQLDIRPARAEIRAYVETTVACGFDYLLAYDHVLGADITNRPNWGTGYTKDDTFHEIFALFGYISAIAPDLELVTGVVILPQRQTVLVAKQAAQIDIFTNGKFRLGVGVGWNAVEFEGLNESFTNRGRRQVEQIDLMRRLWTEPVLTYRGEFHTITDAGLNPLPIQRPIPIWIGGTSDVAIKRAATIADGWFPLGIFDDVQRARISLLRATAKEAGRDPAALGIDARVDTFRVGEPNWQRHLEDWQSAGASHVSVGSMSMGLDVDGHRALIERFARAAEPYRT